MSDLYPFLLVPEFHERVWGTRDLNPFYTLPEGSDPIGEVWLTADSCRVANGACVGQTVGDLCRKFGSRFVGEAAPGYDRFPLLIKFLFPQEKLSIQVHPNDEAAREIGQPCGKTECWYVARANAGAQVGLGLKKGTTQQSFRDAVNNNTAEHLINWIDVHSGDMVYVDAGTVHAVCPGAIILETQQNSDTTYRLYDYGRPRELHIEQGMKAMSPTTSAGKVLLQRGEGRDVLVAAPNFIVERFRSTTPQSILAKAGLSSAQVVIAVEGSGSVECESSEPVNFGPGQAVVVPAEIRKFVLRPHGSLEFLQMRMPEEQIGDPITSGLFE